MNLNLLFLLSGVAVATFGFAGVFFFKFWRASRDQFFLYFWIACALLSIERLIILLFTHERVGPHQAEISVWVYTIRLLAFAVILTAVIVKNKTYKGS